MTVFRLGWSEVRRNLSGTLPRLAMLALAVIPSLYAGLYLFANFDPYGHLDKVPAAVVVQDEGTDVAVGTDTSKTEHHNYGDEVADELTKDGGFDWVRTTQDDAERGVRSGRYDAALVLGPTFSADLASPATSDPRQASLVLVTNDANNYLARTIADTIVGQVRDTLAQKVGTQAADTFLRGFASIHTNLADAVTGADKLADGATRLRTGAASLDLGASTLASGAGDAADGARQVAGGAASAHAGATQLASGASTLSGGASQLAAQTPALASGAKQVASGASDLSDGAGTLAGGLDTLRSKTADLPAQTAKLADGAQQVADGNAQLADAADQLEDAADSAVAGLDDTRATISAQLDDLVDQGVLTRAQADDVLARLDDAGQAVRDGVGDLDTQVGKVDQLAAGAQQVATGASTLASSTPALTQGIAKAASGADDLASGATTLSTGASKLATGAQAASDGASKLADGAQQLDTGAASLATGTSTLADGASSLATGTRKVADGADDLASGAHTLHTGTGSLVSGSKELADGLRQGLGQVPDLSDDQREATASTIANPVEVVSQQLSKAGSYGAGLAPFFLSLAAWIGAYVTFLIVKPLSKRALAAGRGALRTALGGLFTPALLAIVQVVVMLSVTALAVGVHVEHVLLTGLFLTLVAITFAAILQTLNVYLGAAGQFLGLVLMLTQLVTAGGTFPWQTIPEPLRTFHRFLPMSYSVEGLRQLLFGGNMGTVWRDVAVIVGFLVVAVGLTTWAARRQRVWRALQLEPELVL